MLRLGLAGPFHGAGSLQGCTWKYKKGHVVLGIELRSDQIHEARALTTVAYTLSSFCLFLCSVATPKSAWEQSQDCYSQVGKGTLLELAHESQMHVLGASQES